MPDTDETVSRETTDLSPDETGTLVSRETTVAEAVMPYRGETYEQLQSQADTVYGAELEEGNRLIGIPFIAIRLTYRPGEFLNPVTNTTGHYVSIDLITGNETEFARGIRRGRIKPPLEVEPEEHLVINEGGTGVYRQTVEYLENRGWITLPDGPRNGEYGTSRFDTPVDKWRYPDASPLEVRFQANGEPVATVDIKLECPRGLRASEYENAYTKSGVTRYIA